MQLEKSVRAVERLFAEIDKSTTKFLSKTNVKCPSGCTKCCHGKDVSATPLEFLPYAYDLYRKGELEDKYWEYKNLEIKKCLLVEGDADLLNGKCTSYPYRGVICRTFGSGCGVNKLGIKTFNACKILKEQSASDDNFQLVLQKFGPTTSDYYMKLRAIDSTYGAMLFPINVAIMKSMEIVYYNTRRKRKRVG